VRRALLFTLPLLLGGGLLAACGSDDDSDETGMGPMDNTADHMDGMEDHRESSEIAAGAREIDVSASSFAFDPDEIEVKAGEDVAIVLTSTDILHDFTIDELDAHVAADAGETAAGGLRADGPGSYTFYCTVSGHREAGMEGTLVVEE
jgi:cytochrome c oxidase subunit 2